MFVICLEAPFVPESGMNNFRIGRPSSFLKEENAPITLRNQNQHKTALKMRGRIRIFLRESDKVRTIVKRREFRNYTETEFDSENSSYRIGDSLKMLCREVCVKERHTHSNIPIQNTERFL